jgi:hypothetical protein
LLVEVVEHQVVAQAAVVELVLEECKLTHILHLDRNLILFLLERVELLALITASEQLVAILLFLALRLQVAVVVFEICMTEDLEQTVDLEVVLAPKEQFTEPEYLVKAITAVKIVVQIWVLLAAAVLEPQALMVVLIMAVTVAMAHHLQFLDHL